MIVWPGDTGKRLATLPTSFHLAIDPVAVIAIMSFKAERLGQRKNDKVVRTLYLVLWS